MVPRLTHAPGRTDLLSQFRDLQYATQKSIIENQSLLPQIIESHLLVEQLLPRREPFGNISEQQI